MPYVKDQTDVWMGLRDKGAITNPPATSEAQTVTWIYQYAAQRGCWYFRVEFAAGFNLEKPQSDKGSMSQADETTPLLLFFSPLKMEIVDGGLRMGDVFCLFLQTVGMAPSLCWIGHQKEEEIEDPSSPYRKEEIWEFCRNPQPI